MPSAVAGIVDKNGGMRVVVTQRWRMRNHVRKGERLFVLPDLEVEEPVPWDDIPPLIARVEKHVTKTVMPINHCGDCRACCFMLHVPDLNKPSQTWCEHCDQSFGCKIYAIAPKVCKTWKCWWRASQERNDRMAPELRPDQCGAIFTDATDASGNDPLLIECHGEPNTDAWRWIDEMQAAGYKVKKIMHYTGEKKS